jgi:hypothetical protein
LRVVFLTAALATGLASSSARADEDEAYENHVGAGVGIASPVGELGLTIDNDVTRALQVQLGLGLGFSGWQVSLMPRYVFRLDRRGRHALLLGAGPSLAVAPGAAWPWRGWGNAEVGYQNEHRRFFLQVTVGLTMLLGGHIKACETVDVCGWFDLGDWHRGDWSPAGRVMLGRRF